MARDAASLRRHIEESFGQMPYPGDDHILAHGHEYTGDYAFKHLKARHWRSHPPSAYRHASADR